MISNLETLNSLLRGELSAVETYSKAIHKFPNLDGTAVLETMRKDHLASVSLLRELVLEAGGDPATDSGAWGEFAKAVEATAAFVGPASAITALTLGEKHGEREYSEALANESVENETKVVIREKLLPSLQRHVLNLESLGN